MFHWGINPQRQPWKYKAATFGLDINQAKEDRINSEDLKWQSRYSFNLSFNVRTNDMC